MKLHGVFAYGIDPAVQRLISRSSSCGDPYSNLPCRHLAIGLGDIGKSMLQSLGDIPELAAKKQFINLTPGQLFEILETTFRQSDRRIIYIAGDIATELGSSAGLDIVKRCHECSLMTIVLALASAEDDPACIISFDRKIRELRQHCDSLSIFPSISYSAITDAGEFQNIAKHLDATVARIIAMICMLIECPCFVGLALDLITPALSQAARFMYGGSEFEDDDVIDGGVTQQAFEEALARTGLGQRDLMSAKYLFVQLVCHPHLFHAGMCTNITTMMRNLAIDCDLYIEVSYDGTCQTEFMINLIVGMGDVLP